MAANDAEVIVPSRRVDLVTTEGLSRHLALSVLSDAQDAAIGA
jgi:hypothetical protein